MAPTAMLTSYGIDALGGCGETTKELLVYSSILSANLGNKIIPSGSLATLIWIGVIWRICAFESRGVRSSESD